MIINSRIREQKGIDKIHTSIVTAYDVNNQNPIRMFCPEFAFHADVDVDTSVSPAIISKINAVYKYDADGNIETDPENGQYINIATDTQLESYNKRIRFFNKVCQFMTFQKINYILDLYDDPLKVFNEDPFVFTTLTMEDGSDNTPLARFDDIAKLYVPNTFEQRLNEYKYTIRHILEMNEQNGNTFMYFDDFANKFNYFFNRIGDPFCDQNEDLAEIHKKILYLVKYFEGEFILGFEHNRKIIAFAETEYKERTICNTINNYRNVKSPFTKFDIPVTETDVCEEQRLAAIGAMTAKGRISIITGGPGTGKTTVIRSIIKYMGIYYPKIKIKLLAPTGKAASRIKEQINNDEILPSTVHKFLGYGKYKEKPEDVEERMTTNVIIIDEASMEGMKIFGELLSKIDVANTKIILVGDVEQLPSVDAGNLLCDMINQGIPTFYLKINHRNAGNIAANALKVINGQTDLVEGTDFEIIEHNPSVAYMMVGRKIGKLDPKKNIAFSPYKSENIRYSSKQINHISHKSHNTENCYMSVGDRVIFNHTNYDKNYINGECGTLVSKGSEYQVVKDDGDRVSALPYNLDLAYALTIHKSQGSEYDNVSICLPENTNLVTRRMLYTAITRAKVKVTIYAKKEVLNKVINNNKDEQRLTFLSVM